MSIWVREDGTITDEGDPTAFEHVPVEQRDDLAADNRELQLRQSELLTEIALLKEALESTEDHDHTH